MVEERKPVHNQGLEPWETFEAVAQPFGMWAAVYLGMSRWKMQGVCELPY
jgi:hypothetical protein